MKIRDRLFISAGVSILLVLVLIFMTIITSHQMTKIDRRHERAYEIYKAVSELDIILYEYLLHGEERMEQQWNHRYDSIATILKEEEEDETGLTKSLFAAYDALGVLFSRVIANNDKKQRLIQEKAPQKRIDTVLLLEERLVARLLITSQSIITDSSKLTKKLDAEAMRVQELARNLTLVLLFMLVIILMTISFVTARSISRPLYRLIKGTEIIGKGNLEHTIDVQSMDEVGELATAFNQMAKNLKKLTALGDELNREITKRNKELEQIIYITSHDLRSPLINIQGFSRELDCSLKELTSLLRSGGVAQEVRKKVASIIDEEISEYLHHIIKSVSKMDSLLIGLLKLSRLGRALLKIEKIDMNRLISNVVNSLEYRIKEVGAELEIAELPPCKGDMVQINQVFSNLLDNALQYFDPRRPLVVRISGNKEKARSVYCIEDNGLGISSEYQEYIFKIFHRLKQQADTGEGLGLTIVRTILNRHGGKVWVESESARGSRFYVSLPSI